jgi:DNA-binding NtrC family response regulator
LFTNAPDRRGECLANFKTISDLPPQRRVVLVVEDEHLILMALAAHLGDKGFSVREACCAADAIAILEEPGCLIDLVFSDVRMPGEMDGFGLSRWIFENRPNVPVILASGNVGQLAVLENLCGAGTMAKPYDFDVATAKITLAINNNRVN